MMGECEQLAECSFYNDRLDNMPPVSDCMKRSYCKSNFEQCAIYRIKVSMGRKNVPHDLFPNDQTRAKIILNDYIGFGG